MSNLGIVSVVGVIVVAALAVVYMKLRQRDMIGAFLEKRRAASKVVSRAEYVEGASQITVALSLSENALHYENQDMEASFDLDRLDEIEYTDDLATGRDVHGCRVLRLRSHGATFEFLLEHPDCEKWRAALPPRSYGNQPAAHAV